MMVATALVLMAGIGGLELLGLHPLDWVIKPLGQWWNGIGISGAQRESPDKMLGGPSGAFLATTSTAEAQSAPSDARRSEQEIRDALPLGLTAYDASGGHGIHRAVRRDGVWFPVFSPGDDGSDADPATAGLNQIELAITSGNPPPATVGQPYQANFNAIGGSPPYQWSMRASGAQASAFLLDPTLAALSGQASAAGSITLASTTSTEATRGLASAARAV